MRARAWKRCRRWPSALLAAGAIWLAAPAAEHPRFTPEMETFVRHFKPAGSSVPTGEALSPQEAWRQLSAAEGYRVDLVASEPLVRQPIDLRFDSRGRLWIVQYLQYPFPAGLTITAYDQYLRAQYDRDSPPPPRHFRGADRITILEDTDGDGVFDRAKDFVDGLNLATSVLPGEDGIWVLQSPYLLYYPDRDGDDVPDGGPEVHLTGFNLEDTHSLASNLHWGPDGWIYGATGSTTTLDIQGINLQGQGIWRYHPDTKVFEIFAEGGGNTFSFEFDRHGRAYSGTNHGATRGLHYVQGATYVKGWTKHGPAMNPFIFGFFEHMEHQGDTRRFPQTFLFYEGGLMPALEGQIVVGMALTNRVQASRVWPDTSSFRTEDSILLLDSQDQAFRPVDIEQGPDGAIYVADWYDLRKGHLNPADTWDKNTGRIYRIAPAGFRPSKPIDFRKLSTEQLLERLTHPNREHREVARRLLGRRPENLGPRLRTMLKNETGDAALEALWVLNLRGELDLALSREALRHPNEHVRRWAVRLLGDQRSVPAVVQADLAELARKEASVEVRSQLASTAQRLPAGQAFPIIRQLLNHDEDAGDKHLPLLIWWAIEKHAQTGKEELLAMLADPTVWRTKIFAETIAERLGQRYTADQGPLKEYTLHQGVYSSWQIPRSPAYLRRQLEMGARLLEAAPRPEDVDRLIVGMAAGLTGKPVEEVPPRLQTILARVWRERPHHAPLVVLAARLGQPGAMAAAIELFKQGQLPESEQQPLVELFSAVGTAEARPLVAERLKNEKNAARQAKLLEAFAGFDGPEAAEFVMELYPNLSTRLRIVAQRQLSRNPSWALAMLKRMEQGRFDPGVLAATNLEILREHRDPEIAKLLAGVQQRRRENPAELQAQRLFDEGKVAYAVNCAACHQENGQGHPGLAPSLVASPWVQRDEKFMARILINGKENRGRGFIMPPQSQLDDQQIAAVLTYVKREFGNQAAAVLPAKVAEIRQATGQRQALWTDEELARIP